MIHQGKIAELSGDLLVIFESGHGYAIEVVVYNCRIILEVSFTFVECNDIFLAMSLFHSQVLAIFIEYYIFNRVFVILYS